MKELNITYSEPLLSGDVGFNNNVCWSEPHSSLHKLHQDDRCLAGVSSICAIFGDTHSHLSGYFSNNLVFVSNCILQEKLMFVCAVDGNFLLVFNPHNKFELCRYW